MRELKRKLTSPTDLVKYENETPSLAYIAKKLNEPEIAVTLVKLHILDMNNYLNLVRPMTPFQIDQTADMILDEFPQFKIADLIYTFKQAKKGAFGKIYEGLDGMKILEWIRQVFDERCEAGAALSEKEHGDQKRLYRDIFGESRTSDNNDLKDLVRNAQIANKTGKLDINLTKTII